MDKKKMGEKKTRLTKDGEFIDRQAQIIGHWTWFLSLTKRKFIFLFFVLILKTKQILYSFVSFLLFISRRNRKKF